MKKTTWFVVGLLSLFLMGCNDVLTVATVNKKGEKVIHNYISVIGNTVYDSSASINNWKDIDLINGEDYSSDELLFSIVNKKEKIVVLGNPEGAIEIVFFDGGFKYTGYISADGLSQMFNW